MKYGDFDIENREYVITRPDTPTPWINYLGFGGFGGFISNNGGGLLFNGDPGKRRLTRYHFGINPVDRPGRYVYIKDLENNDFWSPTWQPVLKKPEFYECRHGLSYTTIKYQYSNIKTEMKFYIPKDKNYEVWHGKIKNNSDKKRNLKLFPYVEFSYHNAEIDNMAEWARYTLNSKYKDRVIYFDAAPEVQGFGLYGFFSTTLDIEGFDTARDKFIGPYRDESNPIAVEEGCCHNLNNNADHSCGAFCCPLTLNPFEEKEFIITIGAEEKREDIEKSVKEALDFNNIKKDLSDIKEIWDNNLSKITIDTPDSDMNKMINIWHAYQCHTTFNWSRYISYYERGSDRGLGFRDSMQDVLGIMHAMPEKAKERIKMLLAIQKNNGNAKAVYYPSTGETKGGGRSDDHLWSAYSVCAYIKETGDFDFLYEKVPFEDGGEGTVLEHIKRGLQFTKENLGAHNIPKFLNSDWNDSISQIGRGGKAESSFVFFQAAAAAYVMKELLSYMGEDSSYYDKYYEDCRKEYKKLWDGKWFLRGYTNEGEKFGTDEDTYNKIFLNPQSWAVLSHLPSEEEANKAFDNVNKFLLCKYGYISHYPASDGYDPKRKSYFELGQGVRENGGVFCHASTWAVIAQTMLKRNDDAFKGYKATLPAMRNDEADITLIEPYTYGSAFLGPTHERFGAGSNSWLTGTASWMYYGATKYILGFKPTYGGFIIDPCVPTSWNGFKMTRVYRNIKCNIEIKGKGNIKELYADNEKITGNFVPYEMIKNKKEVKITGILG